MSRLRVSDNRRFLVDESATPFFYLGDTAWELFHRCDRASAEIYLRDRAAKRFTVIQAVVLAEFDGLRAPNAYGHLPLHDEDPSRLNEDYFAHVDYIVDLAAALGLVIAMLPTWGDKWNRKWGVGPEIFTQENARAYGLLLGRRYADSPIIWVVGGDRPVETDTHRDILTALAEGLREGDGDTHLITFHPMGGQTSAQVFHEAPWLDFNMWQSGHDRNRDNYHCITADYALMPIKPCMDAEPGYEDHPAGFKLENGYLEAYDVRKAAYWALFAGAHGHTYGCHPIWQFQTTDRPPVSFSRRNWHEALHLPGSGQLQHARALLESRPVLSRIPDQSLVASEPGQGSRHVQAARDESGSYAFVYLPYYDPVIIDLDLLSGDTLRVHWYDPRTGAAQRVGDFQRAGKREFTPPPTGPDWVLVLDDTARGYPMPGQRAAVLT